MIRLLVMPPHGELKIEAHGLPMMDVHARLMQATAFLDRELTCLRMEERAAARAAAVQLARDVPGRPPFKL